MKSTWRYTLAKGLFKKAVRLGPVTRVPFIGKWYHKNFATVREFSLTDAMVERITNSTEMLESTTQNPTP